jgi:hypothetical protein
MSLTCCLSPLASSASAEIDVTRLQEAFSRVVSGFYPLLGGRLGKPEAGSTQGHPWQSRKVGVVLSGEDTLGVPFEVRKFPEGMDEDDTLEKLVNGDVCSFERLIGENGLGLTGVGASSKKIAKFTKDGHAVSDFHDPTNALCRVVVIKGAKLFLVFLSMAHLLGDAGTYFRVLRRWEKEYRGIVGTLRIAGSLDPAAREAAHKAFNASKAEKTSASSKSNVTPKDRHDQLSSVWSVTAFLRSERALANLKLSQAAVTVNEAVTSLLCSILDARKATLAADLRGRWLLEGPASGGILGNAVVSCCMERGLSTRITAPLIRDVVRSLGAVPSGLPEEGAVSEEVVDTEVASRGGTDQSSPTGPNLIHTSWGFYRGPGFVGEAPLLCRRVHGDANLKRRARLPLSFSLRAKVRDASSGEHTVLEVVSMGLSGAQARRLVEEWKQCCGAMSEVEVILRVVMAEVTT